MKRILFVALGLLASCGDELDEPQLKPIECKASTYTDKCTDYKGNLVVAKPNQYDNLKTISGDLIIRDTSHSIVSFRNLESITGSLTIFNNQGLEELRAPKLTSIGTLYLDANPKLTRLPDWSRVEIGEVEMEPVSGFGQFEPEGPKNALFTVPFILALRCAAHPACRSLAIRGGKVVAKVGYGAAAYFSSEWAERNLCNGSCYEYVFGKD